MFDECRTHSGSFPPEAVIHRPTTGKKRFFDPRNLRKIEEGCSSLVITGDQHGYFWICSAWSSLTTDELLSKEISKLPKLLQTFLYQQASGRNLVFLIFLGHLCEKLSGKYDEVLKELDQFVGLGV